ncbi:MAG: response regulator [Cytophagaceae bacterium]
MTKINTVLLVDDDEINNFINGRLLNSLDIAQDVRIVKNGQEALKFIGNKCRTEDNKICPELILLDQNMPVMDGVEFLEEFNKLDFSNKDDVVIIMLSAASEPADKSKIETLGISGFMIKPLTKESVLEVYKKHFVLH